MRVNREALLHRLESVHPGLDKKETVQQSDCFVFQKGEVMTFNDEIACRGPSDLDESFTGAIPAEKLLEVLRKRKEEELEVEITEGHLLLSSKGRRSKVRLTEDIVLDIHTIEHADHWQPLHEHFGEAIGLVQHCASTSKDQFAVSCVHLTPDYVEACSSFQLCRWQQETGLTQEALVRRSAIKHITTLGMTEVAEGNAWIHFRNASGLLLSCRRYLEEYPALDRILEVKGRTTPLPKGIAEAAALASIFSSEDKDDNYLDIWLRPGKLRIRGYGITGEHEEIKKINYKGERLHFRIAPDVLIGIIKRYSECILTPERLAVMNGPCRYVACLMKPAKDLDEPVVVDAEVNGRSKKKRQVISEEA